MNAQTAWLWTDSLCLDQDSHSELNVQIAHMGDIYSRAAHVLSWLGESEGGVDALNIMADFLAVPPAEAPGVTLLDMRTPAGQRLDRAWTQLTRLEGSEYWQRVWVLQEVACAKTSSIVYGPVAVDFERLLQCHHLETLYQSWTAGTQKTPYSVAGEWMGKLVALRQQLKTGGRSGLLDLIELTSGAISTRDVDRIYGLVGLCCRLDPDFDPNCLEIDYDKGMEDIAWDLILLTIENSPSCLWEGLHRTITRVFKALGGDGNRTAPPGNHHRFEKTSKSRAARTQRISQWYEAVIASGYARKAQWQYWLADDEQEWTLDYGADGDAAEALDHVYICRPETRQGFRDTPSVDAMIGLSLLICAAKTSHNFIEKPQTAQTQDTASKRPRLCVVHLPEHLRKIVHKLKPVPKAFTKSHCHALPYCDGGTPANPCDELTVYLEIPELGLVVQSVSRGPAEERLGFPVDVQWFCTRCPIFSDKVDQRDQMTGSILPSRPSKATRISVLQKTVHNSWGRPF